MEGALNDGDRQTETGRSEAAEPHPGPRSKRHQAQCPRGPAGWLMALLMRRMNAEQNRLTVRALRVRPGDAVLEVGCGPGDALALVARETPATAIAGVDHSALMVRMATRRNRVGVRTGRLAVRQADVAAMPFPDGRFDVAFAVNSYHQWDPPVAGLREIKRVLRPDGRLVLSIRVLHRDTSWETVAQGRERAETAPAELARAGFRDIETAEHRLDKRSVVLVSGVA